MKDLIRGGQITTHSLRMATQLFLEMFRWGLIVALIVALTFCVVNISLYELKSVVVFHWAQLLHSFGSDKAIINITNAVGQHVAVSVQAVINNSSLAALNNNFFSIIISGLMLGFAFLIGFWILLFAWFCIKGKRLRKEKFLRGGAIVKESELATLVSGDNPSQYFISQKVPYPKNAEKLHTLILGSTGSGKTNALFNLIKQIRSNGDRAIIYDKMGSFTAHFYDERTDIILNPLDARSPSWSLFNEAVNESDFDYLAAAFVPEEGRGDPFWTTAARSIISIAAKKIKNEKPDATNKDLIELLLRSNHVQIANFLKNTDVSSLADKSSEKTIMSIMAVISAYIRSISYLHDDGEKFSIRKWIENDDQKGFLFISSKGDQHDSLKPLISAWMDIAVKSLLSLNKKEDRTIFVILDELSSLQSLPSLLDGLAQSRQFGGAFIPVLHSMSQLRAVYGRDKAATIASLCRNKLFFSIPDNETAEYCSDDLGFNEVEETKESISYGAHEVRDGVSLNMQKSTKRLVMPTELTMLKNLSAYLKLAGSYPIAKVEFSLTEANEKNLRFIQKEKVLLPLEIDKRIVEEIDDSDVETVGTDLPKKTISLLDD